MDISTLTVESAPELAYQSPSTLAGVLYAKYFQNSKVYAPQLTRLPLTQGSEEYSAILQELEQRIRASAGGLDLAFVGIGAMDFKNLNSSFFKLIRGTNVSFEFLEKKKAVGEINNRPYNELGQDIFAETGQKTPHLVALELSFLKQMVSKGKPVIAVAGGPEKIEAIRVALKYKMVNILITDYETAEALVKTD